MTGKIEGKMQVKRVPKTKHFENGWIDFRISDIDHVLVYAINVWFSNEPQRKDLKELGFVKDRNHLRELLSIKRVELPKIVLKQTKRRKSQ